MLESSSSSEASVLDNVQNYMNYASCSQMYTKGQISKMHAALESSIASRKNLWSESNLGIASFSILRAIESSRLFDSKE